MESYSDQISCLQRNPIFSPLTEAEFNLFKENSYEAKYKKGEIIFKQGTAITHIMSFVSGLAKIYLEGLNNRNLIIKFVTPNTIVWGPGMYVDYRHHYTVSTIEDSNACFIDINVFSKINSSNTEFALNMLKKRNVQRIANFRRFISLTQKQMPGRIADALLYLSEEVYRKNPFNLSISRQDLAELTAMSKESTIRIIKQFKEEGIIRHDKNILEILDIQQLKRISELG